MGPVMMLLCTWTWGRRIERVAHPLTFMDNWDVVLTLDQASSASFAQVDSQLRQMLGVTKDFCQCCEFKLWLWAIKPAHRLRANQYISYKVSHFRSLARNAILKHTWCTLVPGEMLL